MEFIDPQMLLFLLAAGFCAAFVDSVVGGGGLISLPALLLTGLPPGLALGTNKMASVMGSFTSTLSFMLSGKVNFKLIRYLFFIDFFGSVLGVYTVQNIPPHFLKPLVVVLLMIVTVYTLFRKDWGDISTYGGMTPKTLWISGIAAWILGFYDGFFGPGTGSFLIFAFLMLGFDFVVAAGNAKALNFASNIAAVITFAWFGSIRYSYGVVMGLAMILGALAGSRVAIRNGAAFVKPVFVLMSLLLIGKQIWDVVH